jgi:hypothetical protein
VRNALSFRLEPRLQAVFPAVRVEERAQPWDSRSPAPTRTPPPAPSTGSPARQVDRFDDAGVDRLVVDAEGRRADLRR